MKNEDYMVGKRNMYGAYYTVWLDEYEKAIDDEGVEQ